MVLREKQKLVTKVLNEKIKAISMVTNTENGIDFHYDFHLNTVQSHYLTIIRISDSL